MAKDQITKILKEHSWYYGINRGEPALISCRNGRITTSKISKHLEEICNDRKEEIIEKYNQNKKISDYEYRQLQLINYFDRNGIKIIETEISDFKDGEIKLRIDETVTGKDVYVIQNTLNPRMPQFTSQNILELELMVDALLRSEASHVNIILPYMSYSKQERRQGREPISAKRFIDKIVNCGAERITTMDLHADAIEGFTSAKSCRIQNLYASSILLNYFIDELKLDCVWIAPDPGAGKKVKHYSKVTGYPMALGYKYRDPEKMHEIDEQKLLGEINGKNVAIIDDQTAGSTTMLQMAKTAKNYGATKVYGGVTHGMLLGDGEYKFKEAKKEGIIEQLVMTDTLIQPQEYLEQNKDWLIVKEALHMFADAIFETHVNGSISRLYKLNLRNAIYGKRHKSL
jgi:ribose-phosphate pyrophosphokinase